MSVFAEDETDGEATGTVFAVVGEIFEACVCTVAHYEGCTSRGEDGRFGEVVRLWRGDEGAFAELAFGVYCASIVRDMTLCCAIGGRSTWSVILGCVECGSHCLDKIVGELVDFWIIWEWHSDVAVSISLGFW